MEPFQFRLEKVHDLKMRILEERERELGVIVSECNLIKQRKKNCTLQLLNMVSVDSDRNFSKNYLEQGNFRMKLLYDIEQMNIMLKTKQSALDEARNLYYEALKEKKVLDKLREKKAEEYNKQKFRHEMKYIDDIAGHSHFKK